METKRFKTDCKKFNSLRTLQPLADFKTLSYVILLTHKNTLNEFLFVRGWKVAGMFHRAFSECKLFPKHRYRFVILNPKLANNVIHPEGLLVPELSFQI